MFKSKWFLPVFTVAIGAVFMAAQWIGGHPRDGVVSLVILTAVGVAILLAGGSETVRGLRGDGSDERFRRMDMQATAATGLVLVVVIIVAFVVEVARGHSGMPFTWLGAIGGVAYLASVVTLRVRG